MEWFVVLILVIVCLIFVFLANSGKNETTVTGKEVTIDLTPYTWKEDFELAGVHIEPNPAYIMQFVKPKHPVKIYNEQDNKYSSRALVILHEGFKIGYIKEDDIDEVNELRKKPHLVLIEKVEWQRSGYLYVSVNIYY